MLSRAGLTDDEIAQRKAFLEFADDDVKALTDLNAVAKDYVEPVIEDLYRHFLGNDETRAYFADPAVLERVKGMQRQYFLQLTEGDYGARYVANRLKVGLVHQRIGLDVKSYLGAYNFYLRAVMKRLFQGVDRRSAKAAATLSSLMKLVFFDISLAVQTYVQTIERQQEAIRELSTPVLAVRPRLLMLPIIGVIDSQRAAQLTDSVLRAIREHRAKAVVMDVTGVPAIDSKVADHLLRTAAAARLMGATVIVTGITAEVAQALVSLGVDLSKFVTAGDLQRGLEEAERLIDPKRSGIPQDGALVREFQS